MAIKSRMPASGAIEKAIEALNDGLEISGSGTEVQLPDKEVQFEPDVEITELPDGGAEINTDPNAPIDQSQIPYDANLAEYLEESDLQKLADKLIMLNPEERQELQLILRAKLMPEMAKKQQEGLLRQQQMSPQMAAMGKRAGTQMPMPTVQDAARQGLLR